jgi:hypothetical protein
MPDIWSLVGKVAALLGVVWVGLQIWYKVFHRDYRLTAVGDFGIVRNVPTLERRLYELARSTDPVIACRTRGGSKDIAYGDCTEFMTELGAHEALSDLARIVRSSKTWIRLTLTNRSNKQVTGIRITVPGTGCCTRVNNDLAELSLHSGTIDVGALLPGEVFELDAWTDSSPSFLHHRLSVKVMHANGSLQVVFPERVTGPLRFCARHGTFFVFLLFIVLSIGVQVIIACTASK